MTPKQRKNFQTVVDTLQIDQNGQNRLKTPNIYLCQQYHHIMFTYNSKQTDIVATCNQHTFVARCRI
jgi:hypothetical protein